MWDEEPSPWEIEETPAGDGAGTGEGGEGGEGGEAEKKPERPVLKLLKLDPPKYNHHWVRPLFLNYDYLYEYRKNYYDDYIDYLNCRNRGIFREPPRPQEWAERALRTYDERNIDKSHKRSADMKWITKMDLTPRHYSYHTRAYYSLKYQKIL
ncbi:flightin [Prorops nasuta]|uniref:flightin n=1 Tax=Prorops nasuta TaxID=863751 RepID=UPI0034CDD2CD